MTSATSDSGPHGLGEGVRALRAKWGWIVALGVIFMLAGVIALGSVVMATATAVFVIGIMMIMAGVAEIIAAFSVKGWGKFIFWMLLGALYVATGVICFYRPFEAATILTMFLGAALVGAACYAYSSPGACARPASRWAGWWCRASSPCCSA